MRTFSIQINIKIDFEKFERSAIMKNNNFELTDCNNPTASSSNDTHGAKLIWRNVSVLAKADANANKFMRREKQKKRIINNSTGYVKPGVLLAVMGARYMQHFILVIQSNM